MNGRHGGVILIGGGVVLALASLQPWVHPDVAVGSASAAGIHDDSRITGGLGVVCCLAGAALVEGRARRVWAIVACMCAVLAVGVTVNDVNGVVGVEGNQLASGSVGVGLWVALLASLATVLGASTALLLNDRGE